MKDSVDFITVLHNFVAVTISGIRCAEHHQVLRLACLNLKALIDYQALSYDKQTLRQSPSDSVSDRNLACAILIRHKTLSDGVSSLHGLFP